VTTSSTERGRRLVELGATDVLDRAGNGEPDAPTMFDVIIDIVGGADVPAFIDRLAPNGRMVIVGAIAGFPPEDFGMRLLTSFQSSPSVATFSLDSIAPETRNAARAELLGIAAAGGLHPIVHDVLPLSQAAAEAHHLMDIGAVFGRIVLTPPS
jgi:NADPH2:quinone reductase